MKIVLITNDYQGGYLLEDVVTFLKERGFTDENKEFEKETPVADWLKRNDPLLIEAVEKFAEILPCLEVLEVPEGNYTILSFCNGPHNAIREVLVKANSYWQTSNGKVVEIPVVSDKQLTETDKASAWLCNRLKEMGITHMHQMQNVTPGELIEKYKGPSKEKFERELHELVEEL